MRWSPRNMAAIGRQRLAEAAEQRIEPPALTDVILEKLPVCLLSEDMACRYARGAEGDRRCYAVKCVSVSCPHKGTPAPLKTRVVEEQRQAEKVRQVFEPPPRIKAER